MQKYDIVFDETECGRVMAKQTIGRFYLVSEVDAVIREIAALTIDRDTAMSMLEDAEARVKRQAEEIERYKKLENEIVSLLKWAKSWGVELTISQQDALTKTEVKG